MMSMRQIDVWVSPFYMITLVSIGMLTHPGDSFKTIVLVLKRKGELSRNPIRHSNPS